MPGRADRSVARDVRRTGRPAAGNGKSVGQPTGVQKRSLRRAAAIRTAPFSGGYETSSEPWSTAPVSCPSKR